MKKPSARGIEKFLGFEPGTFDHIPHYARDEALCAIRRVRDLESRRLFRPGLYYIVLSDLCRATETSVTLGADLNRRRVETFILTCVDALGHIQTNNYSLFLREIGDAVLIIFSSFSDVYDWWRKMQSWLCVRNAMWSWELSSKEYKQFTLEAKTVVHAGEVDYSGGNIPISAAVNQVFKIEKLFSRHELGMTHLIRHTAGPLLKSLKLRPRSRGKIRLPGETEMTRVYLADTSSRFLNLKLRLTRPSTLRGTSGDFPEGDASRLRTK